MAGDEHVALGAQVNSDDRLALFLRWVQDGTVERVRFPRFFVERYHRLAPEDVFRLPNDLLVQVKEYVNSSRADVDPEKHMLYYAGRPISKHDGDVFYFALEAYRANLSALRAILNGGSQTSGDIAPRPP